MNDRNWRLQISCVSELDLPACAGIDMLGQAEGIIYPQIVTVYSTRVKDGCFALVSMCQSV